MQQVTWKTAAIEMGEECAAGEMDRSNSGASAGRSVARQPTGIDWKHMVWRLWDSLVIILCTCSTIAKRESGKCWHAV